MYIRNINFEVQKLGSTKDVDSAQDTTATLHRYWLDIKTADVSAQKGLSNLFASKGQLENEKKLKARDAFEKYGKQGEPRKRKIDHQTDLIQICRFNISSYSTPEATKPKTIPQLNSGPSPGQTNVVCLAS